jgi:hypothetical protein
VYGVRTREDAGFLAMKVAVSKTALFIAKIGDNRGEIEENLEKLQKNRVLL